MKAKCFCGETFEKLNSRHKYCSKQCSDAKNRPVMTANEWRKCKICGKPAQTSRNAFCGEYCKKVHQREEMRRHNKDQWAKKKARLAAIAKGEKLEPVARECQTCGKAFHGHGNSRFCQECKDQKAKPVSLEIPTSACALCGDLIPHGAKYCRVHRILEKLTDFDKRRIQQHVAGKAPAKCGQCPSRTQYGRCGGVTSGEHVLSPAVTVRLLGLCPRAAGVRDVLDKEITEKRTLSHRFRVRQCASEGIGEVAMYA